MLLGQFAKATKDKKKRNYLGAVGSGLGAAYIGQQTVRSGIPRLLGVRLESHSTSKKNAREILKNGGFIDPNKSGTGAIRALEANVEGAGTDINKAKNKVYITGVHKDAIARDLPNPANPFLPIKVDPKNENPLQQVLNRAEQRRGYRGQSTINWDYVSEGAKERAALEKKARTGILGGKYFADAKDQQRYDELFKQGQERLGKERTKAALKGALPGTGRSLYIGGSDEFFNKNFKPDFDDPRAMYSEDAIKVAGNRFGAVRQAIKREGLLNLMKANKGRVAAGAGILTIGGLGTAALARRAYKQATGDIKVKDSVRKTKGGKTIRVKGYARKRKK